MSLENLKNINKMAEGQNHRSRQLLLALAMTLILLTLIAVNEIVHNSNYICVLFLINVYLVMWGYYRSVRITDTAILNSQIMSNMLSEQDEAMRTLVGENDEYKEILLKIHQEQKNRLFNRQEIP